MVDEPLTYMSIQITFGNTKTAYKYCDSLSFQVGDEVNFGLTRFRLCTTCGAGYMKNTAEGKIILTIEGWTQWRDVNSDGIEQVINYYLDLSKSKPEKIEIFIKGAMLDRHYLGTWKASDPNYFRTSSISDNIFKGIKFTLEEADIDRQLDSEELLLIKLLRQHTTYNRVRYWYLTKLKDMPYL